MTLGGFAEHGKPVAMPPRNAIEDKLSKSLIGKSYSPLRYALRMFLVIDVYRCAFPPNERQDHPTAPTSLKVLATMKLATFRAKLTKALRIPRSPGRNIIQVWLLVQDRFVELDDDDRSLDWYGIEDESDIFVYVTVQ